MQRGVAAAGSWSTSATTVAQNTDSSGEKPISMKAMIETSDRKWNQ